MSKNQNDFLFDSRIVQRNIRDGRVERSEVEKHMASLPDLKDQCEETGDDTFRSRKPGLAVMGEFSSNEQDEE